MSIENSMLRIGRILSADYGLKVEVRGKLAYAKPGLVVLPSISSFEWLGKDAERMLHGLLDHEVGHALFSDFSLATIEDPRLKTLWNAIEDGYVERAMRRKFPGCSFNLKSKNDWYWSNEEKTKTTLAEADAWSAFCLALTMILRGTITVKDVEPLRPEVAIMLRAVAKHIKRAHKVESTTQSYAVALDIYDVFRSPNPPPEDEETEDDESPPTPAPEEAQEGDDEAESEESPSDDGEGAEEDAEGQDDEAEEGSSDEEGDDSSEGDETEDETEASPEDESEESEEEGGEAEADGDDGEESDGECEGSSEPEPEPTPDEETEETEGDETSKEIIPPLDPADFNPEEPLTPEDAFMQATEEALDGRYVNYSEEPEYTVEHDVSGLSFDHAHEREMEESREASHLLSQTFEAALLARREKRLIGGHDEGEIDVALLGEYACGAVSSDALYQQPFAEDDRDVAVAILLDCSGSMGGTKARVARQTAYAMSLALSTCGIEHEITGFTTMSSRYTRAPFALDPSNYRHVFAKLRAGLKEGEERGVAATSYAREVYGGTSSRDDLLVPIHCILKRFDETRLDGVSYAHGYAENLDGEAVRWQALRLAQRREPRRVMFVLSDGLPAGHRAEHPGARFLKETVERVNEAGIETYGIGICSDAVQSFYERSWVVRNLQDLMSVSMGVMIETLVSARQEHACVRL